MESPVSSMPPRTHPSAIVCLPIEEQHPSHQQVFQSLQDLSHPLEWKKHQQKVEAIADGWAACALAMRETKSCAIKQGREIFEPLFFIRHPWSLFAGYSRQGYSHSVRRATYSSSWPQCLLWHFGSKIHSLAKPYSPHGRDTTCLDPLQKRKRCGALWKTSVQLEPCKNPL